MAEQAKTPKWDVIEKQAAKVRYTEDPSDAELIEADAAEGSDDEADDEAHDEADEDGAEKGGLGALSEFLEKAAGHKYIKREGGPGNYRYTYADEPGETKRGGKQSEGPAEGGGRTPEQWASVAASLGGMYQKVGGEKGIVADAAILMARELARGATPAKARKEAEALLTSRSPRAGFVEQHGSPKALKNMQAMLEAHMDTLQAKGQAKSGEAKSGGEPAPVEKAGGQGFAAEVVSDAKAAAGAVAGAVRKGLEALDELLKAGGPYIGPRGGKWADPAHTIAWQEGKGKPDAKGKSESEGGAVGRWTRDEVSDAVKQAQDGDVMAWRGRSPGGSDAVSVMYNHDHFDPSHFEIGRSGDTKRLSFQPILFPSERAQMFWGPTEEPLDTIAKYVWNEVSKDVEEGDVVDKSDFVVAPKALAPKLMDYLKTRQEALVALGADPERGVRKFASAVTDLKKQMEARVAEVKPGFVEDADPDPERYYAGWELNNLDRMRRGIQAHEKQFVEAYKEAKARKSAQKSGYGTQEATMEAVRKGLEALDDLLKAGGPYIGPRGGKWADPQHKIPWGDKEKEAKPTIARPDGGRVPARKFEIGEKVKVEGLEGHRVVQHYGDSWDAELGDHRVKLRDPDTGKTQHFNEKHLTGVSGGANQKSGYSTQEATMEKGLPTAGEPKQDQGCGDTSPNGAEAVGHGDVPMKDRQHKAEGVDSDGQVVGVPAPTEEVLSDDEAASRLIDTMKSCDARVDIRNMQAREVARGTAVESRKLRKAVDVRYDGHPLSVRLHDGTDAAASTLAKSEEFYQGGSPALGGPQSMIRQGVLCKACSTVHSAALTTCPECGGGTIVHQIAPGVRLGEGLGRRAPVSDAYLPGPSPVRVRR